VTISRRRFLGTSTLVVAGTALGAGVAAAQGAYPMAELMKPGPLPEMSLGREDAPVTIIEYASMTCSHCAYFAANVFPTLKKDQIDTGRVRWVFREFPLDAIAAAVAMLIRKAPNGRFFDNLDLWFSRQQDWIDVKTPLVALQRFSRQFGFSEQSFREALADQKMLDALNEIRTRAADAFKVDGTPTFFVNGRKYVGIASVDEMNKILADYPK
jgi:protein-disulfide isomerase